MRVPRHETKYRRNGEASDPVDVHVGQQIRRLRIARGVSQTALSEALGISFQQIQKYELGTNRISPRRLLEIAQRLQSSDRFPQWRSAWFR